MPEPKETPVPCQFFGERLGLRWVNNDTSVGVYRCEHPEHRETVIEECWNCPHYADINASPDQLAWGPPMLRVPRPHEIQVATYNTLEPESPEYLPQVTSLPRRRTRGLREPEQALDLLVNRKGKPAGLYNLYQAGTLFMVLSGPSLNTLDLSLLTRRGVITMGVNNSPSIVRTQLWTHVDPAKKFHHGIWRDPSILKIMPERKFRERLREKKTDGTFADLKTKAVDHPGVVGYKRNANFDPHNWLWEPTVNWGNSEKSAQKNGYPRILNVMLASVRIAFYLG